MIERAGNSVNQPLFRCMRDRRVLLSDVDVSKRDEQYRQTMSRGKISGTELSSSRGTEVRIQSHAVD